MTNIAASCLLMDLGSTNGQKQEFKTLQNIFFFFSKDRKRKLIKGWWLGMQKEALKYVKKCDQCQRFASNIHQPGGVLNPLSSPWPFAHWGLDIVGPFPKTVGNKRYLLAGTDYFTKWVEAESLANIRDADAKKFI